MTVNATSRWNPADYAANAAFVPALGAPVLALLAPRPGEHVLDVGCGDGVLTEKIAGAGATVVGVDASPDMIAAARARGLDARVGDCQALYFAGGFDAAFSNAALHWMLDGAGVAAGVFRALEPGARFVGEMGGHGNILKLRQGFEAELAERGYELPGGRWPQWFPTVEEFRDVYAAAGFAEIEARLIPRPTPLPTGISGWLRTFRAGFMDAAGLPEAEQGDYAAALDRRLKPVLWTAEEGWMADYVRLRFTMRKPA